MVSSKRTNLAEDTVEDLLMIKLNLEKVENLEKMGGCQEKNVLDGRGRGGHGGGSGSFPQEDVAGLRLRFRLTHVDTILSS